jgi:hypothetical protein
MPITQAQYDEAKAKINDGQLVEIEGRTAITGEQLEFIVAAAGGIEGDAPSEPEKPAASEAPRSEPAAPKPKAKPSTPPASSTPEAPSEPEKPAAPIEGENSEGDASDPAKGEES